MPRTQHRSSPRRRGLRLAIYEGGLAAVFTELTGGARQIGFALLLGARDLQIGWLAALPSLANLAQLTASFLVEYTGQRKLLSVLTAGLSRLVWIVIVLLPLGLFETVRDPRIWVMVTIVALSSLFAAMNTTIWLSWLSDLVPPRLRGRFFGYRNMVIASVGMAVSLLGAMVIDAWKGWFSARDAGGFLLVFAIGILCGLVALWVQWLMPALPWTPRQGVPFFSRLMIPLRDTNFRRYVLFHLCWKFSVNLAVPFFAVYMLKDLHLSYTAITLFTSLSALCYIASLRFWGQLADRFSAKPVLLLGGIVGALLPDVWLLTTLMPLWIILPIIHILGGLSWAAFNLNQNTLLLALAPRAERSIYLSVYAAITGLMAAGAPIVGGLLGKWLNEGTVPFVLQQVNPYLFLFTLSCLLRALSLILLLRVHEPREVPLERLLLVFGNLRSLNTMTGFDALYHHAYLQGERLDRFVVSRGQALQQALKRLDRLIDVYAGTVEAEVETWLHRSGKLFRVAQQCGQALERRVDTYTTRVEALAVRVIECLTTRPASWWQRVRRWLDSHD